MSVVKGSVCLAWQPFIQVFKVKYCQGCHAKIDELKRKLYIQTKSYDELLEMANNKEKLVAAIPAIQPVNNKDLKRVSSGYGTRIDPFLKVKRMHYGQDFSLPKGSPVYATADGRISILKSSFGGFGKYIYILGR